MLHAELQDHEDRLNRLERRGTIDAHSVGTFLVSFNSQTLGAEISFVAVKTTGIQLFRLLKNFSKDVGSAAAIHEWTANGLDGKTCTYSDDDPNIKGKTVYYWIACVPQSLDLVRQLNVGPQSLIVPIDTYPCDPVQDFDASHDPVSGGTVLVSVTFNPPANDRFGSVKIYAAGYNGVASQVAVAQFETSPASFVLLQTGETITLTAIAVNKAGIEPSSFVGAPTKALTLGIAGTVPCKVIGGTAVELTTGVQISFPANPETSVTQWNIFRGPRTGGFGAAASIGTVLFSVGTSAYNFLDVNGLTGAFEWYVQAQNPVGTSANSAAIQVIVLQNTADITPVNAAGTPLTGCLLTQSGVTKTILLSAGTWQYPFGVVAYNSASVTPAAFGTFYCYCLDPHYQGGAIALIASAANPDITGNEGVVYFGKIQTFPGGGGSGSGGGGGPVCFSGETRLVTRRGTVPFAELSMDDEVMTAKGWRKVLQVRAVEFSGLLRDMGDGLVTPGHLFLRPTPKADGSGLKLWAAAHKIFRSVKYYQGKVWNAEIESEHNYTLANGWVAHNAIS